MRFSVPLFRMALKSTIVNMVVPTNYFLIHFFYHFLKCIMKIYFLLLFNHVILQSKIPVRRFENRIEFNDIELGIENWSNTNLKSRETMIQNLDLFLGLNLVSFVPNLNSVRY